MRVLVTGGRAYNNEPAFRSAMDALRAERPIGLIIHGGCASGADMMADRYALAKTIPCAVMEAHWGKLARAAGPIRNGWMIELLKPDLVVATRGGAGTADCVRQARAAGIEVREVVG